jgi:hypothetical protein
MTRRFDQAWDLMLMAITLSALAAPAMAESELKIVPRLQDRDLSENRPT